MLGTAVSSAINQLRVVPPSRRRSAKSKVSEFRVPFSKSDAARPVVCLAVREGTLFPAGQPEVIAAISVLVLVAEVTSMNNRRAGQQFIRSPPPNQVLRPIRYCGSICFSPQGMSLQLAERPDPETQPFSLKSNWPIIRPSYNGSATAGPLTSISFNSPF